MTKRLDYNQIAPAGVKALAASTATSCRAAFPRC